MAGSRRKGVIQRAIRKRGASIYPTIWAGLTEAQRQQVTESYGRYISEIYADGLIAALNRKVNMLTGTTAKAF
jgi:hypothetical protein